MIFVNMIIINKKSSRGNNYENINHFLKTIKIFKKITGKNPNPLFSKAESPMQICTFLFFFSQKMFTRFH